MATLKERSVLFPSDKFDGRNKNLTKQHWQTFEDFCDQQKLYITDRDADTRAATIDEISPFLGGLSLHLNHLIASCVANYNWPFGTLPFGLFGSNLHTRDLDTYPRTYSGHF